MKKVMAGVLGAILFSAAFSPSVFAAKSAVEINANVDAALAKFTAQIPNGQSLVRSAKGVLVFPSVLKGGIGIGGEYGTGALRINGKTVEYYSTVSASIGFQLGGQVKSVYLLFMDEGALQQFRNADGWKAGVDGSIALVTVAADGSVDTVKTDQPILGFVIGQKGLMYNLTLEGSKYNKIAAV